MDVDTRAECIEAERNGGKVFVGNLQRNVYKEDLLDMFKPYGKILSVWIAKQPPGFAFVTYKDPEDARDAVSALNGKDATFSERGGMRVEVSTNTNRRGGKGGGKGADRGGGRSNSRGRPPMRMGGGGGGAGRGGPKETSRGRGRSVSRSRSRGGGKGGRAGDSRRRGRA